MSLIHGELSEQILGCGIRVHRQLGPGFLEKIYEEALCLELAKAGLTFERQKLVKVLYDGKPHPRALARLASRRQGGG